MSEINCLAAPCNGCPLQLFSKEMREVFVPVLEKVDPAPVNLAGRVDIREIVEGQIRNSSSEVFQFAVRALHLQMPYVAAVGATAFLRNNPDHVRHARGAEHQFTEKD